ncbi:MAG: T9SS type A sorting domain-containing protein [Flavobacteriaceae bacterium]
MENITQKKFSKKLAKYSALTLAIAGIADASGQVVYTDVDPDFAGTVGDSFAIDFNNDGIDDIVVLAQNVGYDIVQVVAEPLNGVIATSNAGYFYASNLAYGTPINAATGVFRDFGDVCAGVGYAGSQFCGEGEGYVGVLFDVSGNTHYGWIRIDVADSANFIVLDYAYEATPDTAIEAGDEGDLSTNDQTIAGFNQFYNASTKQLILSANEAISNITLYNLLGQKVITKNVTGNSEVVDLSTISNGVYIGTAKINNQVATFKIVKR